MNRGEEIFEGVIRSSSGEKIDSFKFPLSQFYKVVGIVKRKYGVEIYNKNKDKDLSWLK